MKIWLKVRSVPPSTNLQTADDFSVHGVSGPGESDWGVQQPSVHSVSQPQSHSSEPSTILLPHIASKFAESDGKVWCVYILHFKKIRRFYGKIPGIWLPVLLPLFLRGFTSRTFLEIKIW